MNGTARDMVQRVLGQGRLPHVCVVCCTFGPFLHLPRELVVSHNIYLWYHKSICIQDISHIAKICFDKDMLTPKLVRSVPALLASDVQMFFLKGV